ncbi:proton-coupled folate transporter-like [Mizuhopecten yessoensis]|uniref:proton-coupled folate transporter-like n=1 Tax=Mizuhopecten yessoensis TaxID=6573 RepID=UPI000B45E50E|nr:proton-coupled folate transporter-like [Mizuhopecten yessoensis]XP_021370633.1 proton-coupled folate transporter-like [Mizuhopecten yessoensis]
MGAFCNQVTGMLRQTTVEPILFLYMFATFLEFPVSQDLIYTRVCLEKFSNSTYICDNLGNNTLKEEGDVVQKEASSWIMYNNVAYTVPAVISVTLFLGPWGDRLGRKIPMMLTIIGNMLLTVCNLIVSSHTDISIKYILIGKVINGMTGGFIGLMMSVYSYIGHISSSKNRTSRVGVAEAMIFLSGTVGVLVSGIIIDKTSFNFVFSFICVIQFLALLYTVFVLENLRPSLEQTYTSIWSYTRLFCKDSWIFVSKRRPPNVVVYLFLEVFVLVILMICTSGENDILLLYTKLPQFNWSQMRYGFFKAGENFGRGLAVLTLLPVLRYKFNTRDSILILFGLVSKATGLLLLGLATQTWQLYLVPVISVLQGFPSAGLRSSMSGLVDTTEQGHCTAVSIQKTPEPTIQHSRNKMNQTTRNKQSRYKIHHRECCINYHLTMCRLRQYFQLTWDEIPSEIMVWCIVRLSAF